MIVKLVHVHICEDDALKDAMILHGERRFITDPKPPRLTCYTCHY